MKKFLAAAALATLASTAMAQTTPAHSPGAMRDQVTKTLRDAGFTNIQVMPDSFVVSAKDKDGRPVSMFISPDAVTEVSAVGATANNANQGSANQANANGAAPTGTGMFVNVPTTDKVSSNLVGLSVYNGSNQDVGTIKDLVLENGQVRAYILSVGGFLGIGDHYVAVSPAAVNVTWNNVDKKWRASMNATADQLKQAPEYKYPSRT